jgi:hypothetical protein
MNDPFVQQQANLWAKREAAEGGTPAQRIDRMIRRALGRAPRPEEQAQCLEFLGEHPSEADWAALAHALFNVKEFIYVH